MSFLVYNLDGEDHTEYFDTWEELDSLEKEIKEKGGKIIYMQID